MWFGGGVAPPSRYRFSRAVSEAALPERHGRAWRLRTIRHRPQSGLERGALISGGVTPQWFLRPGRQGRSRPVLRASLLFRELARSRALRPHGGVDLRSVGVGRRPSGGLSGVGRRGHAGQRHHGVHRGAPGAHGRRAHGDHHARPSRADRM